MPVGVYNKAIRYGNSVYDLSPRAEQYVFETPKLSSMEIRGRGETLASGREQTENIRNAKTAIDIISGAPTYPFTAMKLGEKVGVINNFSKAEREAMQASNYAMKEAGIVRPSNYFQVGNYEKQFSVPQGLSTANEIATTAGRALNAVGGAASAVGLGFDIAQAVSDKKVTRDNAFKMADDATGIVAAVATEINPLAGLAIGLGEKVVTGAIKGGMAAYDVYKKEGKDYKPIDGFNAFIDATTPHWWGIQIGSNEWKQYWKDNKEQKAAAKEQAKVEKAKAKEEYKKLSGKEKAKKFFSPWK